MSLARDIADLGSSATRLDTEGANFKNLIINGGMTISQRIGTTATAITGGAYGLDRWLAYYDGNSYTTQQVADAPASSGVYNSMKLLVTGTSTPNYSFFGQKLEGNNINHIGLGTANCQSFTISFYVKSSVTGVYSISVTNNASNLAYPVQYTINSADTWERKTMTIPAITSGTWEVGVGIGIFLRFNMGSPSSRTDTADGWRTGNFDGADGSTGSISWATTSGASFYITGCQLEVGDTATDFEHQSYGDELARCHRYFIRRNSPQDGYPGSVPGFHSTSGYFNGVTQFEVEMRATPSLTTSGAFRGQGVADSNSATGTCTIQGASSEACRLNCSGMSFSGTNGQVVFLQQTGGDGHISFDAEL